MLSGQAVLGRTRFGRTTRFDRTSRLWTVGLAVAATMLVGACGAGSDTAASAGLAGSLTSAGPGQGTSHPDTATTDHGATASTKGGRTTTGRTTTGRTNTAHRSVTAATTPAGAQQSLSESATTGGDPATDGTNGSDGSTSTAAGESRRGTTKGSTRDTLARADTQAAGAVVGLVNAARKAAGCPALAPNPVLAAVALAHSTDMARSRYFEHESKDGQTPFDRMKKAGYRYGNAAENIAAGQSTPAQVMDSWMHSEGHRKNILDCSLSQIGVGVFRDPSSPYRVYWTQDFATPA